jgi:uncharacterized radical SAM superfamily Fe-S cluster-containing enzyme
LTSILLAGVVREDFDSIMIELTRSLCPTCLTVVDAQVSVKNGRVYMRKRCEEHGWFESLISSDASMYMGAQRFNKPGTKPLAFATETAKGCPYDCGLCPEHKQHTCVGIIEVTDACNLHCPTCFAVAEGHRFRTLTEIERMLNTLVRGEGRPEVVQFSGGEPTIHPNIVEAIELAETKTVKHVLLNTNGIRIAKDQEFVKDLAKARPIIYLQFDGFSPQTYQALRGADLLETKTQAIKNLEDAGIPVVLVATIQRNVYEEELGRLADFALERKGVRGLVLQPTFYSGRHPTFDPLDVVTLPDVVKSIAAQSKYKLNQSDFTPIPCCYPTCGSAAYVYVEDGEAIPLNRIVRVEDYLDYFKNRTVADLSEVKSSLESLFSMGAVPGSDKTLKSFCAVCGVSLDGIEDKVKMILVQPFMDPWNFDVKRVMKCCIHEIMPDGKIIPFCAYNNVYR